MRYADAVERLYALGAELHTAPGAARRKFELEQMRVLMEELGNPQLRFPSVLIAGTNGKGSTAATLASILAAAGYRTGLYTSPHLERVNERIQVLGALGDGANRRGTAERNPEAGTSLGGEIEDQRFAEAFSRVADAGAALVSGQKLPSLPSFFETMTAIAFCYFAEQEIDIAVLEVGMGGRLDATNIVDPLLSVITDISLDHTEWLGSTIGAIAREKAGILRRDGVMITLPQHPEANVAIGEAAVALNVRGVNAAAYLPFEASQAGSHGNRYPLMVEGRRLLIDSPLAGEHQQRNIALAIASAIELRNRCDYTIDDAAIERGICETRWLGRLERVIHGADGISFLLDVGHNPAGAWALRRALSASGTSASTLVFGCLDDKPAEELGQILFPIFDNVVLVEVASPRAASMARMMDAAAATGTDAVAARSVADALRLAEESVAEKTGGAGEIVVTGSVFLVGAVRSALMRRAELHA